MWGYNKTPLVYYHGNFVIIFKGNSLSPFVLLLNITFKCRNRFSVTKQCLPAMVMDIGSTTQRIRPTTF